MLFTLYFLVVAPQYAISRYDHVSSVSFSPLPCYFLLNSEQHCKKPVVCDLCGIKMYNLKLKFDGAQKQCKTEPAYDVI